MAKGSGMIHPQLATMLAVRHDRLPARAGEAIDFLRPAVERSFNSISVDGECSTNDAVCLLANGASGIERTPASDSPSRSPRPRVRRPRRADRRRRRGCRPCWRRSRSAARSTASQARAIASRIAPSPLVKTALFGHDANWGRSSAAAGSAPHNGGFASVDAARVTLSYNGTMVLERGTPLGSRAGRVERQLPDRARPRARRRRGELPDHDLSYDYVRINADYRT
jgi:glutamate N-acetyltransferase/amino-acid N-acetyltransferase